MIKKILFQTHWLLGITFGTILALSGLTGGLIAFAPELINWANGLDDAVPANGQKPLSILALYDSVLAQTEGETVVSFTLFANPNKYVLLQTIPPVVEAESPAGPVKPFTQRVNPYSGQVLTQSAFGLWMERSMHWLRDIHQGHWLPPSQPLNKPIWVSVSFAALSLLIIAVSGFYLRWPRGRKLLRFTTWFGLSWRLKGRAFLRNLHIVMGTVLLLVYFVSAHTGLFQSTPLSWYGQGVRTLLQQPAEAKPPPPPSSAPSARLNANKSPVKITADSLLPLIEFSTTVIGLEKLTFVLSGVEPELIGESNTAVITAKFSQASGRVEKTVRFIRQDETNASIASFLVANNQAIHEGRAWGIPGVVIMALGAFSLPIFYVTGWMMYWQRRKLKRHARRLNDVTTAKPPRPMITDP